MNSEANVKNGAYRDSVAISRTKPWVSSFTATPVLRTRSVNRVNSVFIPLHQRKNLALAYQIPLYTQPCSDQTLTTLK